MNAVENAGQAYQPARTILFGGTFDPVHNAHLAVAERAAQEFPEAAILFIPAANPPHKNSQPRASFEHRVRMIGLACPGCEVSRVEEGTERSYSIDTIGKLAYRGPLAFLIGADAFAEIRTWHRWEEVVQRVEFIVAARPGAKYEAPPGARITEIADVHRRESSSEIRRMIAADENNVPVAPAVLAYIRAHGLYRSQNLKISPAPSAHSI